MGDKTLRLRPCALRRFFISMRQRLPGHGRRFSLTDLLLGAGLAVAGGILVYRLSSGLDYQWDWSAMPRYFLYRDPGTGTWSSGALLSGLITTLKLSLWAIVFGTALGTGVGLCRVGRRLFGRLVGAGFVGLIRNLPPIILVFVLYFFMGDQIMRAVGLDRQIQTWPEPVIALVSALFAPPHLLSSFLSGVVALALLEGAYIAEIVRSGIQSVERGQWEASAALGLSRFQQMRHVVFPQAMRVILPPLAGQFISTIKDSAIVSVVSIQELTFQGMEVMSATYLTFEIWITIAAIYFLVAFGLSMCVQRLEARFQAASS
jgi:polar amino acid transport system permease protein